jgi:hypothetical protein
MNTHKWQEIRDKMGPERCRKIDEQVDNALAEVPLGELRNAHGLSQKMLADALHIQQPAMAAGAR